MHHKKACPMTRTLAIIISLMLTSTAVIAQSSAGVFGTIDQDSSAAITAAADAMTIDESQGFAEFSGTVAITQGSTTLNADRVRAEYGDTQTQIIRIIADGNVALISGSDQARADQAVYDVEQGTITLTGNAFVKQGSNTLRAQNVTINTKTGAAQMSGRVTTTLTPSGGN